MPRIRGGVAAALYPLLLALLLPLSGAGCVGAGASPAVVAFNVTYAFNGYIVFLSPESLESLVKVRYLYEGLILHPFIVYDDGYLYALVYNCTAEPNYSVRLVETGVRDSQGLPYRAFVYSTECYIELPLVYLFNGSVNIVAASEGEVLVHVRGVGIMLNEELNPVSAAEPAAAGESGISGVVEEVLAGPRNYVMIKATLLNGSISNVISVDKAFPVDRVISESTLLLLPPTSEDDLCDVNGTRLAISWLGLWIDVVERLPGDWYLCIGAPPQLLHAVMESIAEAVDLRMAGVKVHTNSVFLGVFNDSTMVPRLLEPGELGEGVYPANTTIRRVVFIDAEPSGRYLPARFTEPARRYMACYGSNGLPANILPPLLVLPAGLLGEAPEGALPLLAIYNITYIPHAASPRPYDLDCPAIPWELPRTVFMVGMIGAVATVIAYITIRVKGARRGGNTGRRGAWSPTLLLWRTGRWGARRV